MVEIARLEATGGRRGDASPSARQLLARVEQLHEFNPMLGHRGVRLGITYPEITEMQTRAIIEAACQLHKEGLKVVPEIMIPLVGLVKELRDQKAIVDRVAARGDEGAGRQDQVPRRDDDRGAARRDDRRPDRRRGGVLLVRHQRPHADDVRLLARRRRQVPARLSGQEDPREGSVRDASTSKASARSCASASRRAAQARPDLKIGICGEHGGDPASVHFFESVKLDYVSASPYRIPVARLAAAQAALAVKVGRLITYYVHRDGETRQVEALDPAWLAARQRRRTSGPTSASRRRADADSPARASSGSTRWRSRMRCRRCTYPKIETLRRTILYVVLHGIDFKHEEHAFDTLDVDFFLGKQLPRHRPRRQAPQHRGSRRSLCQRNDFAS